MDAEGRITGYDRGHIISLSSALTKARVAGETIHMDEDDLNPFILYTDSSEHAHIIYLLDAVTAFNHILALKGYQPRGAALWYLGSEDPSIWSFFTEKQLAQPMEQHKLTYVDFRRITNLDGDPSADELVQIASTNSPGQRLIRNDNDGLIIDEQYQPYPLTNTIRQFTIQSKKIALTFDDGPDQIYTPQILSILRQKHVPATFFIVGKQTVAYPEIVRACWKNGNELGNHSFSHPSIAQISSWRLQGELTSTDRIIESITGRGNLLFRPPYGEGTDSNHLTVQNIQLVARLQQRGYLIVGMNIDPQDYLQPSPDIIVRRIERSIDNNHIILLHDSGGNRINTVKALPMIIEHLQQKGYQFVTVSELLGPQWKSTIFPPLPRQEREIAGFDRFIFELWYSLGVLFRFAIIVSILFGVIRLFIMVPLILHHRKQIDNIPTPSETSFPVTVVIPACNEQAVICRTVQSVLDSKYNHLKIIVCR